MCGRYTITVDKTSIEYHFNAKFVAAQQEFEPNYNAVGSRLSTISPIIRTIEDGAFQSNSLATT
jgi:putative SOS response-associated peptidase YedK